MTRAEWLELKSGDIIVEVATGVEREVFDATRHGVHKQRTIITLYKLRKSWTKSPFAFYTNHDDRGRWKLKK